VPGASGALEDRSARTTIDCAVSISRVLRPVRFGGG
jgi:hypothetical protein